MPNSPAPTNPEQVGCPSCTNTPGKLYTSSHDGRTYIRDCPSCHGTGKVAAKPHLVCAAHQRPLGYCDECRNAVNAAASRPAQAPANPPDELEDAVIDAVIAEFGSPLRVYEPGLEREAAKAKIDRIAAKVVAAHTRTIAREREAAAKEALDEFERQIHNNTVISELYGWPDIVTYSKKRVIRYLKLDTPAGEETSR